jgi:hypothetical protein
VAVYVTGDVSDYQKDFVGTYLLNAIINSGADIDINDENAATFLTAVGKEQSKRRNTLDDSLICELGRKYGIRYICTAAITPSLTGPFTISGRVISVKTGKSRYHGEATGPRITMGNLAKATETVLEKIFGGKNPFVGQTAPTEAATAATTNFTANTANNAAAVVFNANTDTLTVPYIIATAQEPESQPNIAVYVTGDVPENDKTALGTRMLAALVNIGHYRGIERTAQFLAEVEKEHIKQRSGDVDDNQISALGKQFGVNFVCVAAITPTLGSYQVSARIINVETAEVTHIGESTSPLKTIDDLTVVSSEVVSNMFGRQLSTQQKRPKSKYSLGVGALYVGSFDGGITWSDGQVAMPYSGGGVYLFFSHTYAYAHITYLSGGGRFESDNKYGGRYELPDMRRVDLNVGIFGKYPISLWENISVFPTAGLEYNACANAKLVRTDGSKYPFNGTDGHAHVSGDLNELWVKLGAGTDIDIGWNAYMRGELLYGARLANAFELSYLYDDGYTKLAHGLTLRVGAGIRF